MYAIKITKKKHAGSFSLTLGTWKYITFSNSILQFYILHEINRSTLKIFICYFAFICLLQEHHLWHIFNYLSSLFSVDLVCRPGRGSCEASVLLRLRQLRVQLSGLLRLFRLFRVFQPPELRILRYLRSFPVQLRLRLLLSLTLYANAQCLRLVMWCT